MNNRNNRATRVIVASGSLLAIVLIGIPWVDEYLRLRRDAVELTELESRLVKNQARDLQLDRIEPVMNQELNSLLARSTNPTKLNVIRESLIRVVRGAGGRLRRLEIADGKTRPWAIEEDDPRHESMPLYGEESGFVLHKHAVELHADGSLESVRQIIRDVFDQGWLMTTTGLTARPTGVKDSPVTLEIHLVLFGIGPNQEEANDEFGADFANLHMSRSIR